MYAVAREGTVAPIDILLCLGRDRIAIQCKFSSAVRADPTLDNSTAASERQRLHAALSGSSLPLVFISNFPASEQLKLEPNEAYVDRRAGRAFFSLTFADVVYGMFYRFRNAAPCFSFAVL